MAHPGDPPLDSQEEQEESVLEFEPRTVRLLRARRFAQACGVIITQLGPELHGYFRGVLGSDSEGDDLYQDLLLALWRGLPHYQMTCSVRTWVYAIAHHLIFRRRRRYSRKHVCRLDTKEGLAIAVQPSDTTREEAGQRERLRELQESLSLTERELLILRTERGLSFSEMSVILQTAEPTVRKRFQRLVKRLQGLVTEPE